MLEVGGTWKARELASSWSRVSVPAAVVIVWGITVAHPQYVSRWVRRGRRSSVSAATIRVLGIICQVLIQLPGEELLEVGQRILQEDGTVHPLALDPHDALARLDQAGLDVLKGRMVGDLVERDVHPSLPCRRSE